MINTNLISKETIDNEEIKMLAAINGKFCVSIYIAAETNEKIAQTKFSNAIKTIRQKLQKTEINESDKNKIIEPLLKIAEDSIFWKKKGNGTAIFASPEITRAYKVPYDFPDIIRIGPEFHLVPMDQFLSANKFYILTLSEKQAGFYLATRDSINKLEDPVLPKGIADVLPAKDFDRQIQTHGSGSRHKGELFHGHGALADANKEILRRYFQKIDRAVHQTLVWQKAPLVIAAVDYYAAMYRQINNYPGLLKNHIPGNPDNDSLNDLRIKSWEIAEPYFANLANG